MSCSHHSGNYRCNGIQGKQRPLPLSYVRVLVLCIWPCRISPIPASTKMCHWHYTTISGWPDHRLILAAAWRQAAQLKRRRTASNRQTAAAAPTFSDSTAPGMGMRILNRAAAINSPLTP